MRIENSPPSDVIDSAPIDLATSNIFEDSASANTHRNVIDDLEKLSSLNWDLFPGETKEEKADFISNLLNSISNSLDIRPDEILSLPNSVKCLEDQIVANHKQKLLQEEMQGWKSNNDAVGSIFSRYLTSLKDLSFRTNRYRSEVNADETISDDNLIRSYQLQGTYRTARKQGINQIFTPSPLIISAVTNTSIDTAIIQDLLILAEGGFVTSLSQRELVTNGTNYNHDLELQLSGFYRSIKWSDIPGNTATRKVVKLLQTIQEISDVAKSAQPPILDRSLAQQAISSIRAQRLLSSRSTSDSYTNYNEDLTSILERSYRLRKTVRTIPAVNTPFLGEFAASTIANDANVRINDITLVYDIWNLIHGAEITPDEIWVPFLRKNLEQKGNNPKQIETSIEYQQKLIKILRNIDWANIDGRNNREKTKIALQLLATNGTNQIDIRKTKTNINAIYDLDDTIKKVSNPDIQGQNITAAINAARTMDPMERELLLEAIGQTDSAGSGHSGQLSTRIIAHHLLTSPLIREIDKFAKILKGITQFNHKKPKIEKSTGLPPWKEVSEIDSLEQLRELIPNHLLIGSDEDDLLVPMITSGAALGLLETPEKFKHDPGTKFQLLYLLIDSSGSMDSLSRIGAACAILNNRLVAVAKKEAHLFFRFFDGSPYPVTEVKTRTEASKALSHVMRHNYAGGGTNFNNALKVSVTEIKQMLTQRNELIAPQITMITDGQDKVSLTKEDLKGITLNVILVDGTTNSQLTALARSTGGAVIRVGKKGEILQID